MFIVISKFLVFGFSDDATCTHPESFIRFDDHYIVPSIFHPVITKNRSPTFQNFHLYINNGKYCAMSTEIVQKEGENS